jgi:hypothetical protein
MIDMIVKIEEIKKINWDSLYIVENLVDSLLKKIRMN